MDRHPSNKGRKFYLLATYVSSLIVVFLGILTWAFFTTSHTVEPGHELVMIDRPYFFGHNGIRPDTVKEGRILVWDTTLVLSVAVVPLSVEVTFDDIASKDNILLDFSTTFQYQVTDPVKLIANFGEKWFQNNVQSQYATIVRQAVKSRTMSQLMSDADTTVVIDQMITEQTVDLIKSINLPIKVSNITLGRAQPNADVLQQMNDTAREQQRTKTLEAATKSEENRKISEKARAEADNVYRNELKMDSAQFLQLEIAKMYSAACKSAGTCIVTSGQGNVLIPAK